MTKRFFIYNLSIGAFAVFLFALIVFSGTGQIAIALADCQAGAWACSPTGEATAMINTGEIFRCINGSYVMQTSCGHAAKCCVIDNVPKCVALASTCGAAKPQPEPTPVEIPTVVIPFPVFEPAPEPNPKPAEIPTVVIPFPAPEPVGPCSCDISSTDPKTCCKCDSGSFCSLSAKTYRKCVNGCYQESACASNQTLCNQITQLCTIQSDKCKTPGQVTCGIKPGYLQVCQKENSCLSSNYQCGLNDGQKQQLADLFKDDNANLEVLDKPQYQTQEKDPNVAAKKKEFETQIIENIKTNPDLVRLLCLNFAYALSCGCDPELNPKYNDIKCTDIKSQTPPPAAKTDCNPCSPGTAANATFGCGQGLTAKDTKGIYDYKKCEPNPDTTPGAPKGCWGKSQPCAKDNPDGCYQICLGARGIMTWDLSTIGKEAKAVTFFTDTCPKTFCMTSGSILSLNAVSKAQFCDYKISTDTKLSGCLKCHKDTKTNEAVCDQGPGSAGGKCGGVNCKQGQTCLNGKCADKYFILDASKLSGKLTASQATQEICRQIYDGASTSDLEIMAERLSGCQNLVKQYTDKDGNFDLSLASDISKQAAANPHIQELGQFSVLPDANEIDTQKDKDLAAVTFTPYTWSASQNKWVADTGLAGRAKLLNIIEVPSISASYPRNERGDVTDKIQTFIKEFNAQNKFPEYKFPDWVCTDYAARMIEAAQKQGIPAYLAKARYQEGDFGHVFVAFDTSGKMSALGGADSTKNQDGIFAPQEFILYDPSISDAHDAKVPRFFHQISVISICKNFDYFLWKSGNSDLSCHNSDSVHFAAQGIDPNVEANTKYDPSVAYTINDLISDKQKTAGNVTAKQKYLTYSTRSLTDSGAPQSSLTLDISKFGSKMTAKEAASEIYSQLYPLTPITSYELMAERMESVQNLMKPYIKDGIFDLNKFALSADNADLGPALMIVSE